MKYMKRKYKVIDLFSGVGGFSLGFKNTGFDITLANEIDVHIAEAYKKNHPATNMMNKSIEDLNLDEIAANYSDTDVVIGGPPCQGFSQKGGRKTIYDERNFLYEYFYSFVQKILPTYFVIENVPNILTTEKGLFKNEIYHLFENLGYKVTSSVLNASHYGVPQSRRRAFIIGKLGSNPLNLPLSSQKTVTAWDAISDLSYHSSGDGQFMSEYLMNPKTDYQLFMRKNSSKLYNHVVTKHSDLAIERMKLVPENGGRNDLPTTHHTRSIYSGTWGRIHKDKPSVTITTRFDTPSSGRFTHPTLNRAITVREAARLQSFPDDFIFIGTKTSQMKQVGNAVPPLLAQSIAEAIMSDIKGV